MKTLSRAKMIIGISALFAMVMMSASVSAADKKAPTIQDHLQEIVTGYIHLQEALANDTVEHLNDQAATIVKSADAATVLVKKDAKKNEKLIKALEHVTMSAKKLSGDKVKIKEAREQFFALSDNVIELVKNHLTEKAAAKYNMFYCPMAKGYWLQMDEKTRNPYFGKEMLMCGSKVDMAAGCDCKNKEKCSHAKDAAECDHKTCEKCKKGENCPKCSRHDMSHMEGAEEHMHDHK